MADNLFSPDLAGKTINVPHSGDFDESESQVDESYSAVTFGSDGKCEVAATMKAAILVHYNLNVLAI